MGLVLEMPLSETGIDKYRDLVNVALAHDYIDQVGSWITFGEEKYQGTEKFINMLRENQAVYDKLLAGVYEAIIKSNTVNVISVEDDIKLEDVD